MSDSDTTKPSGRWLTRRDAAAYLLDQHGIRHSEQTLARKSCEGGGPKFFRWGRAVKYNTQHLDEYADAGITGPVANTSEASAAAA